MDENADTILVPPEIPVSTQMDLPVPQQSTSPTHTVGTSSDVAGAASATQAGPYPDTVKIKMEPLDDFYPSTLPLSSLSSGLANPWMRHSEIPPVSLKDRDIHLGKVATATTQLGKSATGLSNVIRHRSKNKCSVCGKSFSVRIFLKRHLNTHKRKKRLRNSQSVHRLKLSHKSKGFKRHSTSRPAYSERRCSFALRRLFRNGNMKNQNKPRQVGVMSSNSSCFVCQKWFNYKAVFKLHMIKKHNPLTNASQGDYRPNLYNTDNNNSSSFPTPTMLIVNSSSQSGKVSRATKEKKYKCPLCEKSFTQSGKLSSHKKKHTGEKPFHCSICGKDFALKDHLKIHIKIHTDERPYQCTLCDKAFRQGGHLRVHMQTHTGEKPFHCEICDKSFSQKGSLMSHMRTHTGGKLPHQCTMCDKSFRDSTKLNNHVRTHTGEKPFQCSLCEKAFSQSGDLVRHMRTHTGHKPYACAVCDRQFSEGSNLNKHMRTHTGYRPHKCTICDKAFSEGSTLKNHMRIHSGEKPYQCSVCQKEFIQSGDLYKHMRTHTGEKPHSCHLCGRAFTESSTLKKHMKTHRNEISAVESGVKKVSPEPKRKKFVTVSEQSFNIGMDNEYGHSNINRGKMNAHNISVGKFVPENVNFESATTSQNQSVRLGNMDAHNIDYDASIRPFVDQELRNLDSGNNRSHHINSKVNELGSQNIGYEQTDPKAWNFSSGSEATFNTFKALNAD